MSFAAARPGMPQGANVTLVISGSTQARYLSSTEGSIGAARPEYDRDGRVGFFCAGGGLVTAMFLYPEIAGGGNSIKVWAPDGDIATLSLTKISINGAKFTLLAPSIISGGFLQYSDLSNTNPWGLLVNTPMSVVVY